MSASTTDKTILAVGNCGPDNQTLSQWLNRHFDVKYLTSESHAAALEVLRREAVDLVMVNRVFDADGGDGLAVIDALRHESSVPVMLISNLPDAQARAQQLGALAGIGKAELGTASAVAKIAAVIG